MQAQSSENQGSRQSRPQAQKRVADDAVNGDWMLLRGFWLKQFQTMIIEKIKFLTNEKLANL